MFSLIVSDSLMHNTNNFYTESSESLIVPDIIVLRLSRLFLQNFILDSLDTSLEMQPGFYFSCATGCSNKDNKVPLSSYLVLSYDELVSIFSSSLFVLFLEVVFLFLVVANFEVIFIFW